MCPASIVGWPADRPADDLGESACTSTSMKQHIQDLPYQLIQVIMLLREMGLLPLFSQSLIFQTIGRLQWVLNHRLEPRGHPPSLTSIYASI